LFLILQFSNSYHNFCKIHEYFLIELATYNLHLDFFVVIFVAKCPLATPSCSSFRIISASKVVKHLPKSIVLSYYVHFPFVKIVGIKDSRNPKNWFQDWTSDRFHF
jgi:hypothetical protein